MTIEVTDERPSMANALSWNSRGKAHAVALLGKAAVWAAFAEPYDDGVAADARALLGQVEGHAATLAALRSWALALDWRRQCCLIFLVSDGALAEVAALFEAPNDVANLEEKT